MLKLTTIFVACALVFGRRDPAGRPATRISPVYSKTQIRGVAEYEDGYIIYGFNHYFTWDGVGTPVRAGNGHNVNFFGGNSAYVYLFDGESDYQYYNGTGWTKVQTDYFQSGSYPYARIVASDDAVLLYSANPDGFGEVVQIKGETVDKVSSGNKGDVTVFVRYGSTVYAGNPGESFYKYSDGRWVKSKESIRVPTQWNISQATYMAKTSSGGYLFAFAEDRDNIVYAHSTDGQSWKLVDRIPATDYLNALASMCCVGTDCFRPNQYGYIEKWYDASSSWSVVFDPHVDLVGVYCTDSAAIAYGHQGFLAKAEKKNNLQFSIVYNGGYAKLGELAVVQNHVLVQQGAAFWEASLGKNMERYSPIDFQFPLLRPYPCSVIPSAERPKGNAETCYFGSNTSHIVITTDYKTYNAYPVPMYDPKAFLYRAIVHKGLYILIQYDNSKQQSAYVTANSPLPLNLTKSNPYVVQNTSDFAFRELISNGNIVLVNAWSIDTQLWVSPDGLNFTELYSGNYDVGNVGAIHLGRGGEFILTTEKIMHTSPVYRINAQGTTLTNITTLPYLLPWVNGYSQSLDLYIVSVLHGEEDSAHVITTQNFETYTDPVALGKNGQMPHGCDGRRVNGKVNLWCTTDDGLYLATW